MVIALNFLDLRKYANKKGAAVSGIPPVVPQSTEGSLFFCARFRKNLVVTFLVQRIRLNEQYAE